MTTCFKHGIFHNNLKGNIYGQVYSYTNSSLLPEQESITAILSGLFYSPKLQEIISDGANFK